ncbi:MAG: AAA family ATPase [Ruminococcaceae bacterium]|nr:AAA family ATPase [Oscillospiraceae bacterium]
MAERKKLELISSVEIMNTPMKKQRFIVDGMIYPGLHILSGDPKIGKSWMMLDMCLAVAKGESFLGRKTEQGQVVYMALEDTFVSLQSRMYELTDEPSENLSFALIVNSIGSGLEEDLQECKNQFPNLKLVVIDTLQKIRNTIDTKYGADYRELSALKSLADSIGIAIVLVHHNRKAHDSNPNNLISGTNGIAGCADGLLVFTRNSENAKLHISGRGAPSLELNLKREKAKWILLDDTPDTKPDIFSFMIHDFMLEKNL